jgi:hypothetical protein
LNDVVKTQAILFPDFWGLCIIYTVGNTLSSAELESLNINRELVSALSALFPVCEKTMIGKKINRKRKIFRMALFFAKLCLNRKNKKNLLNGILFRQISS